MNVGVLLPADQCVGWMAALTELLPAENVVDASTSDPTTVDVLVVGNPAASELSRFGSLEFIQSTFAGPDRLLEDPEFPRVPIARTSGGGLSVAMAEFVAAAVMSSHRQFPLYQTQQVNRQWRQHPQPTAATQTVGFLGFGQLASSAAKMVAALGFQVVAWARTPRNGPTPVLTGEEGLIEVLGQSAIVVNLLPLNPGTKGLLDADMFARFRPGAALVQCGRGAQLNTADLLAALDRGQLSHAWLDVFDVEPLPPEDPIWVHPSVTITPHIAADSTPDLVARQVAANINRFRRSGDPINLI